jgi:hypothetical protein
MAMVYATALPRYSCLYVRPCSQAAHAFAVCTSMQQQAASAHIIMQAANPATQPIRSADPPRRGGSRSRSIGRLLRGDATHFFRWELATILVCVRAHCHTVQSAIRLDPPLLTGIWCVLLSVLVHWILASSVVLRSAAIAEIDQSARGVESDGKLRPLWTV